MGNTPLPSLAYTYAMGIGAVWENPTSRWALAFLAVALYNGVRLFWLIVQTWRGLTQQRDFRKLVHTQPSKAQHFLLHILGRNPRFWVNMVLMWVGALAWFYLFSVSGVRL